MVTLYQFVYDDPLPISSFTEVILYQLVSGGSRGMVSRVSDTSYTKWLAYKREECWYARFYKECTLETV